jgi:hypothetical protein
MGNALKESWVQAKESQVWGNLPAGHQVLAYYENIPAHFKSGRSFYDSFVRAYNNHLVLVLSPDDVWIMICLQFSYYVKGNSEQMRSLFVSHEGKKNLTVVTENELGEDQWGEFFHLMREEIRANTKNGITELLESDFSTTSFVEKMISTAVIMDTFKHYFDYSRIILSCGIRNVLFTGELKDWTNLLGKLKALKQFAVSDGWSNYEDNLTPMIEQFIETYKGNVDSNFWDKVFNERYGSLGSGRTKYVSGWILAFYYDRFGKEIDEVDLKDEPSIDVPVLVKNRITNQTKLVDIIGGFGGVSEVTHGDFKAYKPQMSFIVYHDGKLLSEEELQNDPNHEPMAVFVGNKRFSFKIAKLSKK